MNLNSKFRIILLIFVLESFANIKVTSADEDLEKRVDDYVQLYSKYVKTLIHYVNPIFDVGSEYKELGVSDTYFKDHLKDVSPEDAEKINEVMNKYEKSMKEALKKIKGGNFIPGIPSPEFAIFMGEYIADNINALSDIRDILEKRSH